MPRRGRERATALTIVAYAAEAELAHTLERRLELTGAQVWAARSVRHALELARGGADIVAVGWTGARRDHLGLVRRLQQEGSAVPILVALSDPTTDAWVASFEAGADGCVTLYQHEAEIGAHCAALARRARQSRHPRPVRAGPIVVHPTSLTATIRGTSISLTVKEHTILSRLAARFGNVVRRDELHSLDLTTAALESVLSRLRKKLPGLRLKAIRERGYVLLPVGAALPHRDESPRATDEPAGKPPGERPLTELEEALMRKLARHPGRVVPTPVLEALAPSKGALVVALSRLRPKVAPHRIRAVRNRGYVLELAATHAA